MHGLGEPFDEQRRRDVQRQRHGERAPHEHAIHPPLEPAGLRPNQIEAIEKSKKTTLSRFLYALGIEHVGEYASKLLARNFETLDELYRVERERIIDGTATPWTIFVIIRSSLH